MLYNSCFDIIGPIMVGPSSSHTAGAVSIGKFVYDYIGHMPESVQIVFYDSFAETYRGHGTDKAIVGGLLGLETDDVRIRHARELADEAGVEVVFTLADLCPFYLHPNTVLITAKVGDRQVTIGGASLGGGISTIAYINGHAVDIPLNAPYDLARIRRQTEPLQPETPGRELAWTSQQ
ncbi:serine dehydratase beta chain [Brevibacillus fluminis]|uniref:serine dehydratase beta chain n=1 Tax=Brevibacillus fluminis TaxID=511487 RepID=UPI003F894B33